MKLKVAKGQNNERHPSHRHFAEAMRGAEERKVDELGKPGGIRCVVIPRFYLEKRVKQLDGLGMLGGSLAGSYSRKCRNR